MCRALMAVSCLLAVLAAPSRTPAKAATCTSLASGTWGPIGSGTARWSCGAGTASDSYVIHHAITVNDDITQSASGSLGVVVDGGSLTVSTLATHKDVTLALGAAGLTEMSTGTIILDGGYREWADANGNGVAGETLAEWLPAERGDADAIWESGSWLPCAGWDQSEGIWQPDCPTDDAHTVGSLTSTGDVQGQGDVGCMFYPAARYGSDVAAAVDQIEAGRDVVYFWDLNRQDLLGPAEDGYAYEVARYIGGGSTQAAGSEGSGETGFDEGTARICFSTAGGTADSGTVYPLTRRQSIELELQVAAEQGPEGRTLYVQHGVIEADGEREGDWIRFSVPTANDQQALRSGHLAASCPGTAVDPCVAGQRSYLIQNTDNDVTDGPPPCDVAPGCDRIVIADPEGFDGPHTPGEVAWIENTAIEQGDTFAVRAPVRITSATPSATDSSIRLMGGTSNIRGVTFKAIGGNGGPAIFVGPSAVLAQWADALLLSVESGGTSLSLEVSVAGAPVTLERTTVYPGSTAGVQTHGIQYDGPQAVTLRDLAFRYTHDDEVLIIGDVARVDAERIRCQQGTGVSGGGTTPGAGSQSCFDQETSDNSALNVSGSIKMLECKNCGDDPPIAFDADGSVPQPITVSGVFVLGQHRIANALIERPAAPAEDVTILGARHWAGGAGNMIPGYMNRCVVRENRQELGQFSGGIGGAYFSNCLFVNNTSGTSDAAPSFLWTEGGAHVLLYNDLFVNQVTSNSSSRPLLFTVNGGALNAGRVTWVWTRDQADLPTWRSASGGLYLDLRRSAGDVSGWIVSGWQPSGTSYAWAVNAAGNDDIVSDWLSFDNEAESANLASVANLTRGLAPGFRDPTVSARQAAATPDAFEVQAGSLADQLGVGAEGGSSAPGVCTVLAYHAWTKLRPECASAPKSRSCGLGVELSIAVPLLMWLRRRGGTRPSSQCDS